MWSRAKLKFVARLGYGDALPSDRPLDGPFHVFGSNGPFASFSKANTGAPAIIVGRKGSYGKINWTTEPCFASDTTFFIDESTSRNHLRWVYWLLQTLRLDEGTDEAAVPGLNRETAYAREVLVPPLLQQRGIADYLDRETARLDALVAEKERLIELLQEKRTALISHTVTKGLDPDVPLKDSGVEWLGEIPAHWEVKRLKYLATVNDEALPETTDPGMEIDYVDIGNVDSVRGITDVEELVFEEAPSRARRIVRQGDVIISTVRTYLRAIAQIEATDANLIVSTGFAVIRPRQMDDGFVAYTVKAPYFVERVVAHSVGVSYPAINASELACLDIAFLPLPEQRAIAAFLDRETAKIDTLVAEVRGGINHLKERRAALISTAVTGQLEVTRYDEDT